MNKILEGQYVHYTSPHCSTENGRVKSVQGDNAWVVFKCDEEWDNFIEYTASRTLLTSLTPGWVDENGDKIDISCK